MHTDKYKEEGNNRSCGHFELNLAADGKGYNCIPWVFAVSWLLTLFLLSLYLLLSCAQLACLIYQTVEAPHLLQLSLMWKQLMLQVYDVLAIINSIYIYMTSVRSLQMRTNILTLH